MAGDTEREAVTNFLTPLQLVLSCVTREVLSVGGGYHHAKKPHALVFQNNPVALGRDKRFTLTLIQHYLIVNAEDERGPWKVSTSAYSYALKTRGTSAVSSQEVLAYQWHPEGRSDVKYPHLHLSQGAGALQHNLNKAHLPTGRIAIEDVVRCAITELRVAPLKEGWEAILAKTQAAYQQWRTWA